ncbi:MAG: hypothetical protein AAGF44_10495 [Pseudomonadota bacterium]
MAGAIALMQTGLEIGLEHALTEHHPSPIGAAAQEQIACGGEYVVQAGDTLSIISRAAYGPNQFRKLHRFNIDRMGADPNALEVGVVLRLPCDLDAPVSDVVSGALTAVAADPLPSTVAPGAADATGSVEIVFNRPALPGSLLNSGIVDPYLRAVERATAGRVRFTAPREPVVDIQAQLDMLRSGQADAVYVFLGDLADSHPLMQITLLPLAGGSGQVSASALWRIYSERFAGAEAFNGAHLLGFVGGPPRQIFIEKTIATDEELIRVASDALDPAKAGLESTALSYSEARDLGLGRDAVAVVEIDGGVSSPVYALLISDEKWAEIAPADRETITALSGEALAQRSLVMDQADRAAKRAMVGAGLTVIRPNLDLLSELQARARLQWETWIANADRAGVSGFESINAYFKELETLRAGSGS